jgi:hypothetical protein
MCRLAARVSLLDPVRVAFKEHIRKAGTALVMNEEKVRRDSTEAVNQTYGKLGVLTCAVQIQ